MTYVALLRGINVGGNNKVEMKRLKVVFEELGLTNVKTYINSGNIIFQDTKHTASELMAMLEKAIEKEVGFSIKVLLRDLNAIKAANDALPDSWVNNSSMKCDVMFLWENIDSKKILDDLPEKKDFEDVQYIPGAILWRVDREHLTKSRMLKLAGTELYKHMTIRNCNTVRKLYWLMKEVNN
jgi:uncharacterized protein (DUF1697 family)